MCSGTGCSADPPFGRTEMWGVNDEFVRLLVEGSGSLESGDVGAVRELGHGKTANHAVQAKDALVDPIR